MFEVQPLPVRVEPLQGEFWGGYVTRVANQYDVSAMTLLSVSLRRPRKVFWNGAIGIAVTPRTAKILGQLFRLAAEEIELLHLEKGLGRAWVTVTDSLRQKWDPLDDRTERSPRVQLAGPLWPGAQVATCPACTEESPGFVATLWRVMWLPACEKHHLILGIPGVRASCGAPPELMQAQQQLLNWARGDPRTWRMRAKLVAAADGFRGRRAKLTSADWPTILIRGVTSAATPGYPVANRLLTPGEAWKSRRTRPDVPERMLYAPDQGVRPARMSKFSRHPLRVPRSMFTGPVVGLLGDAMNELKTCEKSRISPESLCATAAAMARFGCHLQDAAPEHLRSMYGPSTVHRRFFLVICVLEKQGTLEQFWYDTSLMAQQLRRSSVNYRARRALLETSGFRAQFYATVSKHDAFNRLFTIQGVVPGRVAASVAVPG